MVRRAVAALVRHPACAQYSRMARARAEAGVDHAAGLVAAGRFDLDDLGAVIAQDLRRIGAAEHARQIDHLDPGQRTGGLHMQHERLLALPLSRPGACSGIVVEAVADAPGRILVFRFFPVPNSPCG